MNPYSTAAECMAKLVERYECGDYSKKQQRDIISVRYNMSRVGYTRSTPYVFAEKITERAMNVISENMQSVRGVETESTAIRVYENGSVAPHIVGVTGLISAEEYTQMKSKGYGYTDEIGKSGIENAFEKELRGIGGIRTYEMDSNGNVTSYDSITSKPGNSVYLTIDSKLQKTAQKALKEAVKEANDYAKSVDDKEKGADCSGAAIVVMKVSDFSVICSANYPTYDLSKYYSDYEKLVSDKTVPLFDRAFMGALAPGSTFKPLVASAALQEKAITTKTHIDCQGVYTKNGLKLWCMGFHGPIDMYQGIRDSCNVFFAETARLVGIENIDKYAKRCGLGVKTGVEIIESRGTLAGPEYSREMGSEWYDSFVSPAGIGQSDNQFTPLQLATYAATLANNGVRLRAHVVDKVVSYEGNDIIYETEPEIMDNMGVSVQNLKEVQKAMNIAANNYSALQDFPVQIAGKTGTAENAGSDHANFICYAPYDKPEIAVGVMVEHPVHRVRAAPGILRRADAPADDIGEQLLDRSLRKSRRCRIVHHLEQVIRPRPRAARNIERHMAAEHLVEHRAGSVHVDLRRFPQLVQPRKVVRQHLGRRVAGRRAAQDARVGREGAVTGAQRRRRPEIDEAYVEAPVRDLLIERALGRAYHDVRGGQVAVDEQLGFRFQACEQMEHVAADFRDA